MNTRGRGWTLLELLAAMAIVALLASLVLPVLATARRKGAEASCVAQLRQVGQAVDMYRADYEGARPPRLHGLHPTYVSDARLLVCPNDAWVAAGGWAYAAWGERIRPREAWPVPVSYGYFWLPFTQRDDAWRTAQAAPGRPGYAVCVLHGERGRPSPFAKAPWFEGQTLRLCFDGSVVSRHIVYACGQFDTWQALTDQTERPLAGPGR